MTATLVPDRPRSAWRGPEVRFTAAGDALLAALLREGGEVTILCDRHGEVSCFGRGDVVPGPTYALVATVRGCPVYIDRRAPWFGGARNVVLAGVRDRARPRFRLEVEFDLAEGSTG